MTPFRHDLPADGEVHLWTFPLRLAPDDATLLAPDERQRADAFHFTRDRDRFIAGRARLRCLLAGYVDRSPAALRFRYGASGKPALSGAPAFNLSHSGELGALAVARFDLGLDIERVRPVQEDVAGSFFATDEVARLRALPADLRLAAFFACWTRKEAYVKALGDGLMLPLDRFSVSLAPDEPPRLLRAGCDSAEAARWQLHHFIPAPGFVGAIAARRLGWRVRWLTPDR